MKICCRNSEAWYFLTLQDRWFGLFWSTFCLFYKRWHLATKVGKTPSSSCGTTIQKYLFTCKALMIILPLKKCVFIVVFTLVKFTDCVLLPTIWDDEWIGKHAHRRMWIWRLLLEIIFFFSLIREPYNKQLNNLDRSLATGKSQTSAYHIDLAIALSIRQVLSLRFSHNDLALGS